MYLFSLMLDCIENSISKNRGFLTKELIKLDEYRSIDIGSKRKELNHGTVIKMDYILNSKKKSFNSKFEIVQTALSDDNIIQLEIKSTNRSQRKSPTISGKL